MSLRRRVVRHGRGSSRLPGSAEIAAERYLSVDTVKTPVRTTFRKLGVTNRTQAAPTARELHLDDPARRRPVCPSR